MNTLRNDEKMVKNGCVKINRGVYSNYRKRYRKHYRKQYRESTAKQKVVYGNKTNFSNCIKLHNVSKTGG